jgi:hypothetical protein
VCHALDHNLPFCLASAEPNDVSWTLVASAHSPLPFPSSEQQAKAAANAQMPLQSKGSVGQGDCDLPSDRGAFVRHLSNKRCTRTCSPRLCREQLSLWR